MKHLTKLITMLIVLIALNTIAFGQLENTKILVRYNPVSDVSDKDIYMMDFDGSNMEIIYDDSGRAIPYEWSSDLSKILYSTGEDSIFNWDFNSDPELNLIYTPQTGEFFTWDSIAGTYKVRIKDDVEGVSKYAYSSEFSLIENQSFEITIDMNPYESGWGHPMGFHLSDSIMVAGNKWAIAYSGTHDRWNISDGNGHSYHAISSPTDEWYSFKVSYNNSSQTADLLITYRETGDTLMFEDDVVFDPVPFNIFGLGAYVINREGNFAETHYDNITIIKTGDDLSSSELFVMDSDGTDPVQLTAFDDTYGQQHGKFRNADTVWWARSSVAGVREYWEVDINDTSKCWLTDFQSEGKQVGSWDFCESIEKIVYNKQNPSWAPTGEIYIADLDLTCGSHITNEVRLTNNTVNDNHPAISPNCSKIAYQKCHNPQGYSEPYNIHIMDIDGSNDSQLTFATGSSGYHGPVWSPDGSKIICNYYDGSQYDIVMMNPDGSGLVNLTNTPNTDEAPCDWRYFYFPCLTSSVTSSTPEVPNVDGTIAWNLTVTNCGEIPTDVYGEIYPTIGDCSGTQYDFNLTRLVVADLQPTEEFTGRYWYRPGTVNGVDLAAINIDVGPSIDNYIANSCFEFHFSYQWGRSGDGIISWGMGEWLDRDEISLPEVTHLGQNYPNPFNATTNISFDLRNNADVKVEVFNLAGQLVETIADGHYRAGSHKVNWDASNYSSGIYFYKLSTGEEVITKRMTLLK